MSFYNLLSDFKDFSTDVFFNGTSIDDVKRAAAKDTLDYWDFLTLLSPAAGSYLEPMAVKANRLTLQHFGRAILFFTPLYLSNFCTNHCVYCGFNSKNNIPRSRLSFEDVEKEAKSIAATGLDHLLILTGEARNKAGLAYLKECVRILSRYFSSISIEIYPMETAEYNEMIEAGVDGLTIYQETYDESLYLDLHPKGPKRDYRFRLDAPERGCRAGMRTVNIGALLGLTDWRREAFITGLHAWYLQRKYPSVDISMSPPRMRPHAGDYEPACIVSDADMVQFILAVRLFLPRVGITISTRESASFRENILPLGVTKMSAGSKTSVGGYGDEEERVGQFDVSDDRSVDEMIEVLKVRGYQPVFRDWRAI